MSMGEPCEVFDGIEGLPIVDLVGVHCSSLNGVSLREAFDGIDWSIYMYRDGGLAWGGFLFFSWITFQWSKGYFTRGPLLRGEWSWFERRLQY